MINICLWLLVGALAGGVASRVPSALAPDDVVVNTIAGTLGALLGGVIFMIFDITALHVFNPLAFLIALISAAIAILFARVVFTAYVA